MLANLCPYKTKTWEQMLDQEGRADDDDDAPDQEAAEERSRRRQNEEYERCASPLLPCGYVTNPGHKV